LGELGISRVILNNRFKSERFSVLKNQINQVVLYTPLLMLLVMSFLLTFFPYNGLSFLVLYASIIFVYTVFLFKKGSYEPWLVLSLGIVYRIVPLFSLPSLLSNDIFQYGSFGTKILQGLIPYKSFDAPYPPLSLYVTVPFVLIGDLRFLKAFFSLCDLFVIFIVYKVFLRGAENANRIFMLLLLFPVSLVEYSISGHNDSLTLLLLIVSLVFLDKNVIVSSALAASSVLCKIFPVIFVPFILRHLYSKSKKSALVFISVFVTVLSVVSLPFVLESWEGYISMIIGFTRYSVPYGVLTSLFSYSLGASNEQSMMLSLAFAIMLLIAFCALIFVVSSSRNWALMKSCSISFLVLPVLLPQFHPWYLLWALPFMTSYYSDNLKLIKGYVLLFLFFHILYYLIFSFDKL
jgi:uncharacterized membrane protein